MIPKSYFGVYLFITCVYWDELYAYALLRRHNQIQQQQQRQKKRYVDNLPDENTPKGDSPSRTQRRLVY